MRTRRCEWPRRIRIWSVSSRPGDASRWDWWSQVQSAAPSWERRLQSWEESSRALRRRHWWTTWSTYVDSDYSERSLVRSSRGRRCGASRSGARCWSRLSRAFAVRRSEWPSDRLCCFSPSSLLQSALRPRDWDSRIARSTPHITSPMAALSNHELLPTSRSRGGTYRLQRPLKLTPTRTIARWHYNLRSRRRKSRCMRLRQLGIHRSSGVRSCSTERRRSGSSCMLRSFVTA